MKKIPCKYSGHNSDNRTASIEMPDGRKFIVNFPKGEDSDRNLLKWIKPMEKSLTDMYYRNIALDITLNIKRDMCVYVNGFNFYYDYRDGLVEIYDITSYGNKSLSIFQNLLDIKIIESKLPKETIELIRNQIEKQNLIVKDIVLIKYEYRSNRIVLGDYCNI